jgi:hypothetical protein
MTGIMFGGRRIIAYTFAGGKLYKIFRNGQFSDPITIDSSHLPISNARKANDFVYVNGYYYWKSGSKQLTKTNDFINFTNITLSTGTYGFGDGILYYDNTESKWWYFGNDTNSNDEIFIWDSTDGINFSVTTAGGTSSSVTTVVNVHDMGTFFTIPMRRSGNNYFEMIRVRKSDKVNGRTSNSSLSGLGYPREYVSSGGTSSITYLKSGRIDSPIVTTSRISSLTSYNSVPTYTVDATVSSGVPEGGYCYKQKNCRN